MIRATLAVAATALALSAAPPADAALPGRDGDIAVTIEDFGPCGDMGGHSCEYQNVYTAPRSGGRLERVADCPRELGGCFLDRISWSPDGRFLAYSSGESVYLLNARTGRDRSLSFGHSHPAWSPSGRRLAYAVPG